MEQQPPSSPPKPKAKRRSPADPTRLLERVLKLIDSDTKRIKVAVSREARILDKDTAATLCRYATTISQIKQEQKQEELEERKRLERLSTDELVALFQKRKKNGVP